MVTGEHLEGGVLVQERVEVEHNQDVVPATNLHHLTEGDRVQDVLVNNDFVVCRIAQVSG